MGKPRRILGGRETGPEQLRSVRRGLCALVICALTLLVSAEGALAATLYWDAAGATGLDAGNGTWTTQTDARWWCSRPGGNASNYSRISWGYNNATLSGNPDDDYTNFNGSDANFYTSGTSTITVNNTGNNGAVQVHNITFHGTGYLIDGSTLTFTSGGGTVTTDTDQNATISAPLAGSGVALTKLGTATLTLSSASNSYSGGTNVNAGTLQLGNSNVLPDNTVTINGATLDLAGLTDTVGALSIKGGSVTNGGTLVVKSDYTNDDFGSGNAFNAKGAASGKTISATINASGSANQSVTGAAVTNGSIDTPGLSIVTRVGVAGSASFQVYYGGDATSPTLRGAVQTTNLTGAGFSASPADFALANGTSSSVQTVSLTSAAAGTFNGGTIAVKNNFDNVRDQTLTVTGNVYRLAVGNLNTVGPVNLGRVLVNQGFTTQYLSVSNTAAGDGYSDDLKAVVSTGSPGFTAGGTVARLTAGAADTVTLAVGHAGSATAGAVNGTATVTYTSLGQTGTGLSDATPATPSQNINLTGAVVDKRSVSNTSGTVSFKALVGAAVSQGVNFSSSGLLAATTSVRLAAGASADGNGISLSSGSATDFLGASDTQTTSRTLGGTFTTSGTKNGSLGLAVTTLENGGGGLTGEGAYSDVSVAYTAEVYQPIDLTPSMVGAQLQLSNAAATVGGQRATAKLISKDLAGDASWSVGGFIQNSTVGAGETTNSAGAATFTSAGKMNHPTKTYDATYTVTVGYADTDIVGGAPEDVLWNLSATVTGNVGTLTASVAAGEKYDNYYAVSDASLGSTATLLKGTAAAPRTVSVSWRDPDTGGPLISDVGNLGGTGSDIFALSMNYDPDLLTREEEELALIGGIHLGWYDTGASQWVNAIDGNTGGPAS